MKNDCIFCKIVKGDIPCDKIYEDENTLAFLDINPVNKGHTLVIPKGHYQWMYDTPDDLINVIFTKSKELMKVIKKATKADYVVVAVVGLDVPHFHVHLVPRYHDDGLKNFWPTKEYKDNEAKEVTEKIKKLL